MYRFGQIDSSSSFAPNGTNVAATNNYNSSNTTSSRAVIKRSVSQVPSTDRRPLSNTNGSVPPNYPTSPTSNAAVSFNDANDSKNIDYRVILIYYLYLTMLKYLIIKS